MSQTTNRTGVGTAHTCVLVVVRVALLALLASGCAEGTAFDDDDQECTDCVCGDGTCNGEEGTATCPSDCGSSCGDGVCNGAEGGATCAADCGSSCGDGVCSTGEDAATCPLDCLPAPSPYRYYRVRATSMIGPCPFYALSISEITFRWDETWQANAMTADSSGTIGGYAATVSASSTWDSRYPAYEAFNGGGGYDFWSANGTVDKTTTDEVTPTWLQVDFGSGVSLAITGMRIDGSNAAQYDGCSVDTFYLQGSDDGASWSTIPGSGFSDQDTAEEKTYLWGL